MSQPIHGFGKGPWKCPNPFANHKEEMPIKEIKVYHNGNGIPVGSVKCTCGYKFAFYETQDDDPTLPIVSRTHGLGMTWVKKAKELRASGLTKIEICKILGISLTPLNMLLKNQENILHNEKIIVARIKFMSYFDSMTIKSISEVTKVDRKLVYYLKTHDSEWYKAIPKAARPKYMPRKMDWKNRDKKLVESIKPIIDSIRKINPPQKVTKGGVARLLNCQYDLFTNITNLPLTKKYLDTVVETTQEFRERRINYTYLLLMNQGCKITRSNLFRRVGLCNERVTPALEQLVLGLLTQNLS